MLMQCLSLYLDLQSDTYFKCLVLKRCIQDSLQTCKMVRFLAIVNVFQLSINYSCEDLHLRRKCAVWLCLCRSCNICNIYWKCESLAMHLNGYIYAI